MLLGCDGEVDVAFVIDGSGSVHEDRFRDIVLPFIMDILDDLEVRVGRTRVAAILFADDASMQFPLDWFSEKEDTIQAIKTMIYPRGKTNMQAALRMLWEEVFIPINGDRPSVPNIAFIVTDGQSTVNADQVCKTTIYIL